MSKYYVYFVYGLNGEILYVGKGTDGRLNSHLKGASSNRYVNEYFFSNGQDGSLRSRKVAENLTNDEAFELEKYFINDLKPYCNLAHNVTTKNRPPPLPLPKEVIIEKAEIFSVQNVISMSDLPPEVELTEEQLCKLKEFISGESNFGKQKVYLSLLINGNTGSKHLSEVAGVNQRTAKRWLLDFESKGLEIGKPDKVKVKRKS